MKNSKRELLLYYRDLPSICLIFHTIHPTIELRLCCSQQPKADCLETIQPMLRDHFEARIILWLSRYQRSISKYSVRDLLQVGCLNSNRLGSNRSRLEGQEHRGPCMVLCWLFVLGAHSTVRDPMDEDRFRMCFQFGAFRTLKCSYFWRVVVTNQMMLLYFYLLKSTPDRFQWLKRSEGLIRSSSGLLGSTVCRNCWEPCVCRGWNDRSESVILACCLASQW